MNINTIQFYRRLYLMFTIFTMDQEVNWLWKLYNSQKFNVIKPQSYYIKRKLPRSLFSSGRLKIFRNISGKYEPC